MLTELVLHMNRKIIISFFLFFAVVFIKTHNISAQTGDAGQPGEFLRYGVGARAMGMGRAFTALANDASAIYWNPAGLISANRKEFASMYSNLFVDTRYTYFAVAIPRSLIGNNNALGFGWVNLTMNNFDGRSSDNKPQGEFDIYDQALFVSYAREIVKSWGILNIGLNLKFVNQGFPGYSNTKLGLNNFGVDLGFTYKPINTPIIKKIGEIEFLPTFIKSMVSLKMLMPLQFGLFLQNLKAPNVGIDYGKADSYPFIIRWGASYHKNILNLDVNFLYDQEIFSRRKLGHYGGIEMILPNKPISPTFRFGLNNRADKWAVGGGLRISISDNTSLKLDYSWNYHNVLSNDSRFFLTFDFGQLYDSDYFRAKSNTDHVKKNKLADHLHVITHYPHENYIASADSLGSVYDTTNAVRYFKLIGGLKLANVYFAQAKEKLKDSNADAAKVKAKQANSEYEPVFEKSIAKFSESEKLNYAESLIIKEKYRMSLDTVLSEVNSMSLRYYYLSGICSKYLERWQDAIKYFRNAIRIDETDKNDIKVLSLFNLGQSLMQVDGYNSAKDTLNIIVRNYFHNLDSNYPRYPSYCDNEETNINNIADNAQYLIAICYSELEEYENSLKSIFKLNKLFPKLDSSEFIKSSLNEFLSYYKNKDWDRFKELLKIEKK